MSFQTWLDSIHLYNILYIILVHLLTLGQKLYFQLKNPGLFYPSCFVAFPNSLLKMWKEKLSDAAGECALFYPKHTDKFTSSKLNLLVFQVKTNTAWNSVLLGNWCHNFRHLQHSCSNCAAVLLTFLEDIAQNYLCHCFSFAIVFLTFLKYVLLSYFYHSKSNDLRTRCI